MDSIAECCICGNLLTDPVTLIETQMTYDFHCISEWLKNGQRKCPASNKILTKGKIWALPASDVIRRLIAVVGGKIVRRGNERVLLNPKPIVIPPDPNEVLKLDTENLVRRMTADLLNLELQVQGCRTLLITAINTNGQIIAGAAGAIEAVVNAMKAHPNSETCHGYGCWALTNMIHYMDNNIRAGAAGAIEAVVNAMVIYPYRKNVQYYGCEFLGKIAANVNNNIRVGTAGAVEVVVKAMNGHPGYMEFQHIGCCALVNITKNENNRVCAVNMGAIESVVYAMKERITVESVQGQGCHALFNMIKLTEIQVQETFVKVIKAVVMAMKTWPDNQGVQVFGCVILNNISWISDALRTYARNADAVPIIKAALLRFPSIYLDENAQMVLKKLEKV